MLSKAYSTLLYITLFIVFLSFLFWGLVNAKPFLAPVSVAALLAMMILPIARWLEAKGLNRGLASLFSDLIILLFFLFLAWIVSAQLKSIVEEWPKIEKRIKPTIEKLQEYISEKTGFPVQNLDERIEQKLPGGTSENENTSGTNSETGKDNKESKNSEQEAAKPSVHGPEAE